MKGFCVYVHCKPDMTPFYVGKGRVSRAFDLAPYHRNEWHKRVVAKYGKDNIIIETLDCVSESEAFFREIVVISALTSSGVRLCNATRGGDGTSGFKHSDEERARRSVRAKSNPVGFCDVSNYSNLGRVFSDDHKSKLSKAAVDRSAELVGSKVSALHSADSLVKKQVWWKSDKLKELGVVRGRVLGKLPNATVGTSWVNKAGCNKRIPRSAVESFLSEGWTLGQVRKNSSQ